MASPADLDLDSTDEDRAPIALPEGTILREEYRIGRVLGTGSFGITYRARDVHLDTHVAIKEYYPRKIAGRTTDTHTLRPHTEQATEAFSYGREQFMQEGRTVARFDHPNIVDVRSYFEEYGTGYLVMDYYEGQTLSEYLAAQGGRLREKDALALTRDVLNGLTAVHEAGVLHRDIDPQNVYRTADTEAILIDFGAAREAIATQSQDLSVILKPGYAPLEQYSSDGDQGPHTDVYACAATLYKCLTGLTPPPAPSRAQGATLSFPEEIESEISMDTRLAVRKGLAMDPALRPSTAEDFLALLTDEQTVPSATAEREAALTSTQEGNGETHSAAATVAAGRGEAASTSTDQSVVSASGVAVVTAGIVGGTLALSDARAINVLAFFGTWAAVCIGLVSLFREGEKVMSSEGRAAVSDWLLRESFALQGAHWPATFTDLFDAVFTKRHLTWSCFWRSGLTSLVVVTLLLTGLMGVGLLDDFVPDSPADLSAFTFLGLPIAVNVIVDYISLFETRWVLGKMKGITSAAGHLGYLAIDLMLTVMCILVPVSVVQLFSSMPESSLWTTEFWREAVGVITELAELLVQSGDQDARLLRVMFASTLFTSVWVWAYVGAGLILRTAHPVLQSFDLVKTYLDVETRPLHAMGLLLAMMLSLAFAVSAPLFL